MVLSLKLSSERNIESGSAIEIKLISIIHLQNHHTKSLKKQSEHLGFESLLVSSDASVDQAPEPEDANMKMLNAKRMLELRRRITQSQAKKAKEEENANRPREPTDREILVKVLVERGDEVLTAAEAAYPSQMPSLISQLARLIREKNITSITGGELLQLFRSIGMRVSVSTSISVQEHGRFVSLADKMKRGDE
jgi:DNA-binding TFAR19-related protein (PDSD5 family)